MTCPVSKTCELLSRMTLRCWGLFFAFASAAVMTAVFISQYGFGLQPCELCLYQRIPFYIAFGVSGLLVLLASRPRIATALLGVLALCFLANAGLGLFHMGVEYKWWTYNSGCTAGSIFTPGASTSDILAALKKAPIIKCDDRVEFLFGMTMAFYNMLASFGLFVMALVAMKPSRS